MSNPLNKDQNWKPLKNSELDQNCNVTTPESELCYPKNDFQNHPGLNKLLAYRKLKGNNKCNPNPKDPCVLNTDNMVIPSADVIREYVGATFVKVENEEQIVVCKGTDSEEYDYDKALYIDSDIYRTLGVEDSTENSTIATVEAGSYVTYLINPTDDEINTTKEELNALALADAESQLDCRITKSGSGICPNDYGLFVADRSNETITVNKEEIFEYLQPGDLADLQPGEDVWSKAKERLDNEINHYIYSNLVCVYTNRRYTAYCSKAAYINKGDKDNVYVDFALADNGYGDTPHSKLLIYDLIDKKYQIEYQYIDGQLVPGYYDEDGSFKQYKQYESNNFAPIDTQILVDQYLVEIAEDNLPVTKIAISKPLEESDRFYWLIAGNHQGFSSENPDQPVNPDRDDGLYMVDEGTYFVEAHVLRNDDGDILGIDEGDAIERANDLAKSFAKSQINCTYQSKPWTAECPEGFMLSLTDNNTTVTVEEFKYSSLSNLAQATLLAKAEADARITACTLSNSEVQIFCDRGFNTNGNGEYHSSTLGYKLAQDKPGNYYVYSVAVIRSGNYNPPVNPWPIYIYLNDFDDATYNYICWAGESGQIINDENGVPSGNCYASSSVSLSYYKIDRGYFSSVNSDITLEELNKRAIQLAISSIVCQYGNLYLSAIGCSDSKNAFLKDKTMGDLSATNCLVHMPASCGPDVIDPKTQNCYDTEEGLPACAVSTMGPEIEKDTYFSSSPILANTTAAKIQLASRVCLPCDIIGGGGGGGGGTVTISSETNCGCSSNACIFVT